MKQMSEEKKLRLEELEQLTYNVEIGNTHKVLVVKGTQLNSAYLLGELKSNRRMMLVRQAENERKPVRDHGQKTILTALYRRTTV